MKKLFKNIDRPLLILTVVFTVFGLIMIYSSSSISAVLRYNETSYYFFLKQLIIDTLAYAVSIFIVLRFPTKLYEKITPLVGDYVIIDDNNQITKILPRKNELTRPNIANVDRALVVTSIKEPEISYYLLDKMISLITYNGIKPIICFTKIDLLNILEKNDLLKIRKYYNKIGIKVFYNIEKNKIKRELKNKIVVLVGQTGVGKSSLLNSLDNSLNIKTNLISKSLNRGVHTTRHTELYQIGDMLIADTPGFSSLDFKDISKHEISDTFVEFRKEKCEFNNCLHIHELGCKVKEKVEKSKILLSRYESYVKLLSEVDKK